MGLPNMTLILDPSRNVPYEIGAMLDVALCYPKLSADHQLRIANALCAELVAGWLELEPHRVEEIRPLLRGYRQVAHRASCAKLNQRREKAMIAGQSFLPLIKERALGELPILNGKSGKLSRQQIASHLWPVPKGGFEDNYVSRLHDRKRNDILPWYPVAHLAAAYQFLARHLSGKEQASGFDYQDLGLHVLAVMLAAKFADYFRATPGLASIATKLRDIELIPPI